ncbi:hypothetical protein SAMN04515674_102325 [Pseudarcicella hirudinis]|uniref:Uncharacterized protein n=1 Tax=Pseudarcicella hirudinis TaxID=1079859 RepID=A0A1I5P7C9_9BACT|nr:hypothetical protein [Pseudarcicella hirudinis]SFP30014.1 hypothetical protein SAMN04515674_102325 [Pseudarcicella hirudinis]
MEKSTSYFEYSKIVLKKVSFSKDLFQKELQKAMALCKLEERIKLKVWCVEQFGKPFEIIVERVYQKKIYNVYPI